MGQRQPSFDREGWKATEVQPVGQESRLVRAVESTTEAGVTAARTQEESLEPDESYDELIAIARAHGPEEIKHLTRAYQAIAPAGGGKMIDLTALVDSNESADQR